MTSMAHGPQAVPDVGLLFVDSTRYYSGAALLNVVP